jgi:hypothetical protein
MVVAVPGDELAYTAHVVGLDVAVLVSVRHVVARDRAGTTVRVVQLVARVIVGGGQPTDHDVCRVVPTGTAVAADTFHVVARLIATTVVADEYVSEYVSE